MVSRSENDLQMVVFFNVGCWLDRDRKKIDHPHHPDHTNHPVHTNHVDPGSCLTLILRR